MTGPSILSLQKRGYSLKIFEKLYAGLKKENMSKRMSLMYKMDIFKDYSFPQPLPMDKFLRLPRLPDQAYLILGTKGTGNKLSFDIFDIFCINNTLHTK